MQPQAPSVGDVIITIADDTVSTMHADRDGLIEPFWWEQCVIKNSVATVINVSRLPGYISTYVTLLMPAGELTCNTLSATIERWIKV